jgi:hypothetical protein
MLLLKVGLLMLLYVMLSCSKDSKPISPTSTGMETSSSLNGIWLETLFSSNGKTSKSYHVILQIDSSAFMAIQITNNKDVLEGKVKETLFQDTENNHNLYKSLIMDNEDVCFYRIKDYGTSKAVFMNYEMQKKDNNTLTGTWTFSPKNGVGKYGAKAKWERLRDNFELVNDFGETIQTIQ